MLDREGAEANERDLLAGGQRVLDGAEGSGESRLRLDLLEVGSSGNGVDEVGLSDTTGYGNPAQLRRLAKGIWSACGRERLTGVHLHNTRGQGLANALAAVEIGITTIDSSLGGIGGCPPPRESLLGAPS